MDEVTKIRLQAIISLGASRRDEAHANILSIIKGEFNPKLDYLKELDVQFAKLSEAEKQIESIQMFYARLENLDAINSKENPEPKKEEK